MLQRRCVVLQSDFKARAVVAPVYSLKPLKYCSASLIFQSYNITFQTNLGHCTWTAANCDCYVCQKASKCKAHRGREVKKQITSQKENPKTQHNKKAGDKKSNEDNQELNRKTKTEDKTQSHSKQIRNIGNRRKQSCFCLFGGPMKDAVWGPCFVNYNG